MKKLSIFLVLFFAITTLAQTQVVVDLTSSGTYTVPQGVNSLTVEAWGGGGGGGGARATSFSTRSGSGGGGGSYSRRVISPVTSTYNYWVGSGGAAGVYLNGGNGGSGGDGGVTTFGNTSLINAPGGKGGQRNSGGGGSGGTGAVGAFVFSGGSGADGENNVNGGGGGSAGGGSAGGNADGTTGGAAGAAGGFSAGANGANAGGNGVNGTPGNAGNFPGAGGSGGKILSFIGTYDVVGGAGAQGLIRVRFAKPPITITPNLTLPICSGSSVTLTASSAGNYTYTWSNGATGSSITVSPTTTTTYTVTGTTFNGAGGTFTHTQTITVTVKGNSTVVLTSAPATANQTVCVGTAIANIIYATTGATGIGTPSGLPTGVTANWSGNTIVISGTPTVSGSFNYSIPLTGSCGPAIASGTINVTTAVSSGTVSGTSPLFIGDVTTYTSSGTSGGSWSSSNTAVFTVDSSTGQVTAVGAGTATITYSVTGCGGTASAFATVVVTDVTTWNGTSTGGSWDHGVPNVNKKAAIAGSYETSAKGDFIAKTLTVHSGATLTISPNTYVEVLNEVTNNGRLIVESDGNLKQINNVINTTPISVRRTHTLTDLRKEYNFLSSPVANQNMKMIFGNNAANVPFVTVLRESTNSFVNATSTDYAVVAKGFSVKEPRLTYADLSGDSLPVNEAQYKGVPNNGDITLAFPTYTAGRGYNLVGNPYPSNMDIIDLYANSTTALIDPTFRFWDNSINDIYTQMGGAYQGYSYALFNAATDTDGFGVAAPGDGTGPQGVKVPNRIIKVSQAFMVRATGAGAQLNYNNSMRKTSNTDTVFFGKSSEKNRYRLQLVKSDGFTVQNGISYFAGGNAAFGREDSRIPNSSASDALFSFAGDAKVVINGRSNFTTGDVVQLGLRHFNAGTYKIQAVDREGVFAKGQSVYLKDKQLGIITDLNEGDYIFSSEAGEFTNRFEIVYVKEQTLATAQNSKSGIEVYRDQSDFVVRSQTESLEYAELYDASGRLLHTVKGKSKEIRFNAETLLNGMYLLKAKVKGGAYFTKKIRK